MEKKVQQQCWEFWNCEIKEKCPAFIEQKGRECWKIAGSETKKPTCPKVSTVFSSCIECPWYRKMHTDN